MQMRLSWTNLALSAKEKPANFRQLVALCDAPGQNGHTVVLRGVELVAELGLAALLLGPGALWLLAAILTAGLCCGLLLSVGLSMSPSVCATLFCLFANARN